MSPGNVAREGIPFELFRSTYPGRHVARERYPQRQVARDNPNLSLGNIANVVLVIFTPENGSTSFTFLLADASVDILNLENGCFSYRSAQSQRYDWEVVLDFG
ncbi:hypothetical protein Tco_1364954 [Tanacetum coccineum]